MKAISFALCALVLGMSGVANAADKVNGKLLVEKGNCIACHGANLNAPVAPDYPKLAGQHADYLYHAMLAYQIENNPQVGRSNAIMAGQLNANPGVTGSDGKPRPYTRKELQDMAAYIGSLQGSLVLKR